jgi:hypothetical protein
VPAPGAQAAKTDPATRDHAALLIPFD